ncbi:MAG TPA: amidohydrolase family protein [Acidimicrobiia bacterium]
MRADVAVRNGTGSLVVENAAVGGDRRGSIVLGPAGWILAEPEGDVTTLDAGGRVVVPTFAEPHVHLDRAFSSAITGENRSGCLDEGVRLFKAARSVMTVEALVPGASRALGLLEAAGVSHVRTHTAIGGALGFRAWEAVEQAGATFAGVEVRQVAIPVDSNLHHPEVGSWLREAADRGAVAVGGAPWRAGDPAKATRAAGELAGELGLGLDLHVDESDDPRVDTLTELAAVVEEVGLSGRAVAVHCCSLAGRPETVARREAEALARAGVAVVVCPVSNLCLQGRQTGDRGIAPVRLLREASVGVGIGIDNICDAVVAVGTGDPLRAAWLLAIGGHLTGEEDLEWIGNTVVAGNRRLCGLPEGLHPGDPADVLLLDARSLAEAVSLVPSRERLRR